MAEKSDALKQAIKNAGSAEILAGKLLITPQALSQWETVPPLRVLEVERITGVSRHELRPDLYPEPAQATS
jgi:DNA-binding transcriptional regulator YdaS (Cro superfamily)